MLLAASSAPVAACGGSGMGELGWRGADGDAGWGWAWRCASVSPPRRRHGCRGGQCGCRRPACGGSRRRAGCPVPRSGGGGGQWRGCWRRGSRIRRLQRRIGTLLWRAWWRMSCRITACDDSCAFHVRNSTLTPAYWPCSANATPLQIQCNSSGGYASAVQLECSHGASRLIRLAQLGVFRCPPGRGCLKKLWGFGDERLPLCSAGYRRSRS